MNASRTTSAEVTRAPRWRRTLARAVDAALVGGAAWLWRRRPGSVGARGGQWAPTLDLAEESFRQQLRSPGQLLVGLRTVDRRTGRRQELWRTLLGLGVGVAAHWLMRRVARAPVMTPAQEHDRETFLEELGAIDERHRDEPVARKAERERLFERNHGPTFDYLRRATAPMLAIGLLNNRLRRRLTPTIDILARPESHNP